MGFDKGFAALFFGLSINLVLIAALFLLCRLNRKRLSAQVNKLKIRISSLSPFASIGAAITTGIAEELLLRASIFAILHTNFPVSALALNALLSGAIYIRARNDLIIFTLKAIEGSIMAVLYLWSDSYFLIALTRVISELLMLTGLRFDKEIINKISNIRTDFFEK
jgi:membrane protease YdiL (CAAX protease family)